MANLKASKKDIRRTARRTSQNSVYLTRLDKALKQVKGKTAGAVNEVFSLVDKMVSKGLLKKNAAARIKSKVSSASK
jgi:ribosomal protein S20